MLVLLKPYSRMLFMLLLFALLSNGLNLVLPKIIANSIDNYTAGHWSFRDIILEFSVATLLIFVFTYLQSIVQTFASERVARDLRTSLSAKISRQSYAYIQQVNPNKLLTNLTSDIDSVKMFVSQAIVSIVSSAVIIIGASVLLLSVNWKLGLAVLTIIPLIGVSFFVVLKKVKALFVKSREVVDWLNKVINESILGAALIRVLNSQQPEYEKFIGASTRARDLGISIVKLFATLIPIIVFVSNMAILTILALGGHFVINGSMTLGDFAAFNSYVAILIFPILVIGFMSNVIAQASAAYQRVHVVLHAPETAETGALSVPPHGNIRLEGITVRYGEKAALHNVSFDIPAGSRTAVIGPTAAGKTQLLYLLTGLLQPDEGIVLYDGRPIADYNRESLLQQTGMVFQDSIIFNMTLRENIAFNTRVTDEAMDKAITTAELKDFIHTLPQGLDTVVSERGTSLSGGQKQRIMLARALAIRPGILLLDDFTARVDPHTERKILQQVQNNYPDLTLLSVTQKISSVEQYDQIILLMEGELIAAGTHTELMQRCPEYVQIYNSQRSTSYYEAGQATV
ncbi:ABC transporter ATP-binding protein [Compostibacter hankyongensis]|uniref:ABC transporter ATP-binding protein n=2 Tax=Compostibacter hankyongensis TaxID=1007089 RepID=A0ABP8G0D2_9BACT